MEKEVKKEEKVIKKNYFEVLNSMDVSSKVEKKNGLSYLSWAWAWEAIKKIHPNAQYKIYETETGVIYWTDGKTCWVKTGVIVNDIEHIEYLPVMDFRNKSITLEMITSTDVNKAIQRSLTKALARHGLGLYIYAGEDLPDSEPKKEEETKQETMATDSQLKLIATLVDDYNAMFEFYKIESIEELTMKQASEIIKKKSAK